MTWRDRQSKSRFESNANRSHAAAVQEADVSPRRTLVSSRKLFCTCLRQSRQSRCAQLRKRRFAWLQVCRRRTLAWCGRPRIKMGLRRLY